MFGNAGYFGVNTQLCDWSLRPTPDPIYDYFGRALRTRAVAPVANRAVWLLNVRSYDASSGSLSTIIDSADISRLRFRFNNVYLAATNQTVMGSGNNLITPTAMQLSCQYSAFDAKYKGTLVIMHLGILRLFFYAATYLTLFGTCRAEITIKHQHAWYFLKHSARKRQL
jgi:hypothetical protein